MYQALPSDSSKTLGDRMQQLWEEEVKNCDNFAGRGKKKPSLRRVIVKQFGCHFMLVGMLAFIEECFTRWVGLYWLSCFCGYKLHGVTFIQNCTTRR